MNYQEFAQLLQPALVTLTQAAVALPASNDLEYHRSLNPEFAESLDAASHKFLELTRSVISLVTKADTKKSKLQLRNEDDVLESFASIVDVTDALMEKAGIALDEHRGVFSAPSLASPNAAASTSQTIHKPQDRFIDKIDNARDSLWTPKLADKKYHALSSVIDRSTVNARTEHGDYEYITTKHPYAQETAAWLNRLDSIVPIPPQFADFVLHPLEQSFASKPFTFVDTIDKLQELKQKLHGAKEIAIDLEHNNQRSFSGITCLMQISTREEDFVVDTLVPELRENLHDLNEFFTDPSVIKVLHGAESDIHWLQRDLGLYILPLFDTYHASRILQRTNGHSLSSLLTEYIGFKPDKSHQLDDWRIRPLPQSMMDYARADTHFLLPLYDKIFAALIQQTTDGYRETLKRSAVTSQRVWHRDVYDVETGKGPGGWRNLIRKWGKENDWLIPNPITLQRKDREGYEVFRVLHDWRDRKGRELDESPHYVMANYSMLNLATMHNKPVTISALRKALGQNLTPILKISIEEVAQLIEQAVEKGKEREEGLTFEMDTPAKQVLEPGKMDIDTPASNLAGPSNASGLWDEITAKPLPGPSNLSASRSSLFANSTPSTPSTSRKVLSTATSSLFGPMISSASSSLAFPSLSIPKEAPKIEFRGAVKSLQMALASGKGKEKAAEDAMEVDETPGQHAFVPADKRTTIREPSPEVDWSKSKPLSSDSDSESSTEDILPRKPEPTPQTEIFKMSDRIRSEKASGMYKSIQTISKPKGKKRKSDDMAVDIKDEDESLRKALNLGKEIKDADDAKALKKAQKKAAKAQAEPAPKKKVKRENLEDVGEHDYSAEPSLLGAALTADGKKKKLSKAEKKALKAQNQSAVKKEPIGIDTSAFRKVNAPRAGASMSKTFHD